MKVKSNIVSIEAWIVDTESVKKYIEGGEWEGLDWVKELIDDKEPSAFGGQRGLEYRDSTRLEVDVGEFKTFPPQIWLNGGAVCPDGDYILRIERSFRGATPKSRKGEPISKVYYKKVSADSFDFNYYIDPNE